MQLRDMYRRHFRIQDRGHMRDRPRDTSGQTLKNRDKSIVYWSKR